MVVNKVESHICSVKQSLIGLHKEVMSLSTLHTPSRDDDQQIVVSSTGEIFFSSVPNGVFNLISSSTELKDFAKLHSVIHFNKQCNAHWEHNLRPDVHNSKPLLDVFTSKEALRWTLLVRNIDAVTKPSTRPIVIALFNPAKLKS